MMPVAAPRGWWRRNLWGLLLVLPMLALGLAVPFWNEAYDRWFHLNPTLPVTGAKGAWADYAGGRIRLLELGPVELQDYSKKPFTVPGTRIWRARTAFDTPTAETYGGCRVNAEDTDGRTFADRPPELSGAKVTSDFGCTPPLTFEASPGPSPSPSGGRATFENTYYFVLPASARAVAVRVFLGTKAPRFARLTAP